MSKVKSEEINSDLADGVMMETQEGTSVTCVDLWMNIFQSTVTGVQGDLGDAEDQPDAVGGSTG